MEAVEGFAFVQSGLQIDAQDFDVNQVLFLHLCRNGSCDLGKKAVHPSSSCKSQTLVNSVKLTVDCNFRLAQRAGQFDRVQRQRC